MARCTKERLLTLELAMLEDHGLTLPPETQPLRGFGRKGQTNWRTTALRDTRRALGKAETAAMGAARLHVGDLVEVVDN